MKIFHIISSLGNGGAEKLVVELSNELSINNNVTIISIKSVEEWMYPPKKINRKVRLIQLNKKKGFDFKVLFKLFSLLKREKPDVVHIHLTMSLYYIILLIPFFRKIVFYHTIHNTFGPHEKLFKKLNHFPFYSRVVNICLSKSIFEQFSEAFPKLKFRQIENGIKAKDSLIVSDFVKKEIDAIRIDSKTKIFLFVGRFSYQKNIPLLLDVYRDAGISESKLIIIGNGPLEINNDIKNATSNSSGRIVFLGPKENVFDYMINSDALILTSRHEGLPIVVLEALSVGLPVLSTPVGGVPDVINNGTNGFLAKSIQKKDIIEMVEKFCSLDPQSVNEIHENNIRLFEENFSIEVCAKKHYDLYKNESR